MAAILWLQRASPASQEDDKVAHLEGLGHTVTRYDAGATPPDLTNYDCVIAGSHVDTFTNASTYINDPTPLIALAAPDQWGMSTSGGTGGDSADNVIEDAAHPLAGGYSGTVTFYSDPTFMAWTEDAEASAEFVAHRNGFTTRKWVFGFEAEALGAGLGRRVFAGLATTATWWLAPAYDVLAASVDWSIASGATGIAHEYNVLGVVASGSLTV